MTFLTVKDVPANEAQCYNLGIPRVDLFFIEAANMHYNGHAVYMEHLVRRLGHTERWETAVVFLLGAEVR